MVITLALAGAAAGIAFVSFPGPTTLPVADRHGTGVDTVPDLAELLGNGTISSYEDSTPAPIVTATASAVASPVARKHKPKPKPVVSPTESASATPTESASTPDTGSGGADGGSTPLGGAGYAGSLLLSESGSQLASWNQTSSFCPEESWQVANGTVTTSSGDALLTVNGSSGSCVALVSPGTYSSVVIEADIDFPALPSDSSTIADWTSFWLTDGAAWPEDGELDAVEAEPVDGINAVAWHSGTNGNEFTASTDDFFSTKLPKDGTNVSPGWHTVDVVYTQGFMAVYYDGQEYTSYSSSNVTGDPLNIYITTSATPDLSSIQSELGGAPVNTSSSPATIGVKYLKIWSYK